MFYAPDSDNTLGSDLALKHNVRTVLVAPTPGSEGPAGQRTEPDRTEVKGDPTSSKEARTTSTPNPHL